MANSIQYQDGGYMLPQNVIDEYKQACRAKSQILDNLMPEIKDDPLYIAMTEIMEALGDEYELDWYRCGILAEKLMEIRILAEKLVDSRKRNNVGSS